MKNPERLTSPKQAAREIYQRLLGDTSLHVIGASNHTSKYDPDKHEAYPRAIELKPERFAIQAQLGLQVADRHLVGMGRDTRLPAFKELRGECQANNVYSSDFFSKRELAWIDLAESWWDVDFTKSIAEVLSDPQNASLIEDYQEIIEDILTDPRAEEDYFEESAEKELYIRLNPANSIELSTSSYFLLKWGTELAPPHLSKTRETRRKFLLDNINFFTKLSELEITHANKYFLSKWNDRTLTATEAGVHLNQDYTGEYCFVLRDRVKRPARTFGKPVGCPMGFNLVIERYLTALVNEADDRNLI